MIQLDQKIDQDALGIIDVSAGRIRFLTRKSLTYVIHKLKLLKLIILIWTSHYLGSHVLSIAVMYARKSIRMLLALSDCAVKYIVVTG